MVDVVIKPELLFDVTKGRPLVKISFLGVGGGRPKNIFLVPEVLETCSFQYLYSIFHRLRNAQLSARKFLVIGNSAGIRKPKNKLMN